MRSTLSGGPRRRAPRGGRRRHEPHSPGRNRRKEGRRCSPTPLEANGGRGQPSPGGSRGDRQNCPFPGSRKKFPMSSGSGLACVGLGPDGTSASLSEKCFYAIHEADGQGGYTVLPGQLPVPGAKAINRV